MRRLRPLRPLPPPGFGALLARYRRAAGFSCAELATLVHCDPSYISHLERSTRHPQRACVERCAHALRLARTDTDRLYLAAGYAPTWLMKLAAVARLEPVDQRHVG